MAAFFFNITRNQYIYNKLTHEIRTAFSSVDDIKSGAMLSSRHYLHACLNEALRTMPAVPSETIRVVLPGGLEVDGEFLPEGVLVASTLWSLHHSDKVFRDPCVYRPERWISDGDSE
jgi:cytochrome P450